MLINKFINLGNGYLDITKIIGIWKQESMDYPYIVLYGNGRIGITQRDFIKLKKELKLK